MSGRGLMELMIPLELAELLHATLGPLCEKLDKDEHDWVPMVRRVLFEYCRARNSILVDAHGPAVIPEIHHHCFVASEKVCGLTELAISEEHDFAQWSSEFRGETA